MRLPNPQPVHEVMITNQKANWKNKRALIPNIPNVEGLIWKKKTNQLTKRKKKPANPSELTKSHDSNCANETSQ
jgi:hypothetical protein